MRKVNVRAIISFVLVLSMVLSLCTPLSGVLGLITRAVAVEQTGDFDSMTMSQILEYNDSLTWVIAGDSITHNGGWSQGTNSYGEWIEQYLQTIGRGTDSVILAGIGGAKLEDLQPDATTRNGISVGTDEFITNYNPDVVTIKLGMNNRPLDEATFKTLYRNMLNEVYRVGAENGKIPKIVMISSTPVAGENEYDLDVPGQDSVNRQVQWLKDIQAEYNANGKHLEFVDLRNGLVAERNALGDDYYQTFFFGPSDGAIHPNAAGQYAMFKIIARTLGFYDASMPIFNHDYEDLNEGYMYIEDTYISDYTGDYGVGVSDSDQMNGEMPTLDSRKQPVLLASHDFDEDDAGTFTGTATSWVDLTDSTKVDNTLTLAEVQTIGREFSIVIRTKLNADPKKPNQALLSFASDNLANWNNAVTVGMPGNSNVTYYNARLNGTTSYLHLATSSGKAVTQPAVVPSAIDGDGQWHTIVVVQTETSLQYYLDGVKTFDNDSYYFTKDISEVFANATTLSARIGSYSGNTADYNMNAEVDYFQFYKGALNADEVTYLTQNGGASADDSAQMDKTMPTLSDAATMGSIEFSSTTGVYTGNNGNLVDLTDASAVADPITFAEAQSLGKNYSVVLRAKLEQGGNANAGILLLSGNGVAKWSDALTVGVPSQGYQTWNRIMQGGTAVVTPDGQQKVTTGTTPAGDGQWHTLVITASESAYNFYLDGALVMTKALSWSIDNLGALFTNKETFAARFGRYSDGDGTSFTLRGSLDYFQFYGQTLTADQVAALSSGNDAVQMNATMPTLPKTEEVPDILASADFNSSNGKFGADSGEVRYVDLMNGSAMTDKLTGDEVKAMGKEYSIVFRARLENSDFDFKNHSVALYMSQNKASKWSSTGTLMVSFPGKHATNGYYGDGNMASGAGVKYGNVRTAAMDGKWHTFAVVQSETKLTMYVDGVAYDLNANFYLKQAIGTYFASAVDAGTFEALFGSYGSGSNADASYGMDGWVDYMQLYDGALTASQIAVLTENSGVEDDSTVSWGDMDTDSSLWAIVGGQQMIGYQGSVGARSLLRLLENTVRNSSGWTNRDIHILPFATAGYDPEYLVDNYDTIFGGHDYDVFMLLPDVSDVYADDYSHSTELVAAFKEDIVTLLNKNSSAVKVLWTPLASNDATINDYIHDYAETVRQIASQRNDILFFDANKFMNEHMGTNDALVRNWFEEGANISPLCSIDLASAFYAETEVTPFLVSQEMKNHNLRIETDNRSLKDCVRDYIVPGVTVSGSSITVDASAILAKYSDLTNLRVAVLSATGVGSNHGGNWEEIAYFGSESTVTFTAPWNNAVVTVIGDKDGYSYRFKDVSTSVVADTLTVEHYTDGLTALEVVGAPAIGFSADKTTYDVELYQYQRNVQIRAQGGDNLTIKVNGQEVAPGALSQKIAVDEAATVEVKVTGGTADKTYTLNLTRPDDPDIIITEVMYATTNDTYDLLEIYNASGEELNLLDYAIGYKKDYTDSVYTTENQGKYPYYFTGDDQAFNSRNSSTQTYTGINKITKNSSHWSEEDAVEEPAYIAFPADSTMVLWVKYGNPTATYATLIDTLQNSSTTYTMADGTKVVPGADIIAMAERPNGDTSSGTTSTHYGALAPAVTSFYLDNHNTLMKNDSNTSRSWIFILKNTAVRDDNASVTEAGDDIISASMLVRPTDSYNMSTVLYYDSDRGMALARNPVSFNATEEGAPYYSSQYSYANYTTFGAIEYWQKPADQADTQDPTAVDATADYVINGTKVTIDLTLKDDTDVRYFELYVKKAGQTEYTKVEAKDFVLEAGVKNGGVSADQTSIAYTYDLGTLTEAASYYYTVTDGNGHTLRSAEQTVNVVDSNALNVDMTLTDARGNDAADVTAEVTIQLTQGQNSAALEESYTVTLGGQSYTTVNGKVTVPMANGDQISIAGLPAGTAYTVTVKAPAGYTAKNAETTGTIASGAASGVSLEVQADKKNADLTIKMDIDKYNGNAAASSVEASVKISVTAGSAADHDLTGTYSITGAATGTLAQDGQTNTWTATVALSDGESVVIAGLPVGAEYTLTVTPAGGYADTSADSAKSGTVSPSGTETTLSVKQDEPGTGTLKVDLSVDDTTTHNVTITVTAGADYELTGTYAITGDVTGTLVKNGNAWTATVGMKNGQTVSVTLPQGASYTVALEDQENYTESAAATGTISAGVNAVSMTVSRDEDPGETDPSVPETSVPETSVPETSVPETSVPETSVPETTVPETTGGQTDGPQTGDTAPLTTVAILMLLAAAGIVTTVGKKKHF